jgi:hypothetical protein
MEKLMKEKKFIEIYIGRNGDFDIYAAMLVKKAQRLYGGENNELILILPYNDKNIEYYEQYYDDVRIFEMPKLHPKAAITKRNEWMVDHSNILVAFVISDTGGAAATLKYAERKGVEIINIA